MEMTSEGVLLLGRAFRESFMLQHTGTRCVLRTPKLCASVCRVKPLRSASVWDTKVTVRTDTPLSGGCGKIPCTVDCSGAPGSHSRECRLHSLTG